MNDRWHVAVHEERDAISEDDDIRKIAGLPPLPAYGPIWLAVQEALMDAGDGPLF